MSVTVDDVGAVVGAVWRSQWGRLLALLIGRFRDVDLAEESLAEAFEAAARSWPVDGVPTNPAGWLHTTARRKALDRLRGAEVARRKQPLLAVEVLRSTGAAADEEVVEVGAVRDDELRLLLLTCHPALTPQAQAALALRLVLGVPTAEIARLFLVGEATMAARITRAKKKIATAGLPFTLPPERELLPRVQVAVRTIYLCFTAGYAPGAGDVVVRTDLAGEAIRLARLLVALLEEVLAGRHVPAVDALLVLMLLQHSRRDARVGPGGGLVLLRDQDRGRWHADEIAEGLALLAQLPATTEPYAHELRLQALIAAQHVRAPHADATDWPAIAGLYARLEDLTGSAVVRLNRAVAVAEADGPQAGLLLLEGLEEVLPQHHRVPAVRAELASRAGDVGQAREAYVVAISLCGNDVERAYLRGRLDALGRHP